MTCQVICIYLVVFVILTPIRAELRNCGPDQPLVVEENTRNYDIICENIDIDADVEWLVNRRVSGVTDIYSVVCPFYSTTCRPLLQFATFSRPTSNVSIARLAQVRRAVLGLTTITCKTTLWRYFRSSCDIAIIYPPQVLNLQINQLDERIVFVNEYDTVNIWCHADGRPNPAMRLVSNDQVLTSRPQAALLMHDGRVEINYTLPGIQCEASGDYRCDVDNGVGQSSQSTRLLVKCGPRETAKASMESSVLPLLNLKDKEKHLALQMTAYPMPVVVNKTYLGEFRNDAKALTKDIIQEYCSTNASAPALITCNITVNNLTSVDKGFYSVVFSNGLGKLSFTFEIRDTDIRSDVYVAGIVGGVFAALIASAIVVTSVLVWRHRNGKSCNKSSNQRQTVQVKESANDYDELRMGETSVRSTYEQIFDRKRKRQDVSPQNALSTGVANVYEVVDCKHTEETAREQPVMYENVKKRHEYENFAVVTCDT